MAGERGAEYLNDLEMERYLEKVEDRTTKAELKHNPKDIAGSRKPPLHLVPPVANLYEAAVLQYGATSHPSGPRGEFNWRTGPKISLCQYISAIERHVAALKDGEWDDKSSGLPHLAHIRATTGIILDADSLEQLNDDLPAPGKAAELIARLTREPDDEISE